MIRKPILAGFALLFLSIASMTFWAAGRNDVADAAMKGDKAALRTLIQQKADVNAAQVDGATALHWAVYHLDVDSVDLLIKAGAKADIKNREGITPLHLASDIWRSEDHRPADQSRRRSEAKRPGGRDDADACGTHRKPGSHYRSDCGRRRGQCQRTASRYDGIDVGGRAEALGSCRGVAGW